MTVLTHYFMATNRKVAFHEKSMGLTHVVRVCMHATCSLKSLRMSAVSATKVKVNLLPADVQDQCFKQLS